MKQEGDDDGADQMDEHLQWLEEVKIARQAKFKRSVFWGCVAFAWFVFMLIRVFMTDNTSLTIDVITFLISLGLFVRAVTELVSVIQVDRGDGNGKA
jgi:uncharacterized membrane protein HdeD (DUF308 family)